VLDAVDSEEIDQVVEYWNATDVKTQAVVTKSLGNEEEKSAATADVQDFLRRKAVQIQVLGASYVKLKMFFCVEILRVMTP